MKSRNRTLFWTLAGGAGLIATRYITRQQREIDWAGRTVLVTGGSRGLGLELARQLVDAGANVAICARDRQDLSRARRILKRRAKHRGHKVKVLALPCDVTKPAQVKKTVATVTKTMGPIDALINNAGIIQVAPLAEMEQREYEEAINTHYWGPYYTIQAVLPGMRERGQGRIINIASVGGKVSLPHMHPYSASKHALVGLSEGYRTELLRENIYVTTVCPGLIRTGSPKNAVYKGTAPRGANVVHHQRLAARNHHEQFGNGHRHTGSRTLRQEHRGVVVARKTANGAQRSGSATGIRSVGSDQSMVARSGRHR